MELENRRVVISGGGTGIGLGLARGYAERGGNVLICGRRAEPLEQAKSEVAGLHTRVCDVSDDAQVRSLVEEAKSVLGGIDVLVNNAGVVQFFSIPKRTISIEEQIREIDINLAGAIRMTHHFLPELLGSDRATSKDGKKATIVNVTSAAAYTPLAIMPIYSASKAALHSYSLSLRIQLMDAGIEVIEVLPPSVETPMTEGAPVPVMPFEPFMAATLESLEKGEVEIRPGDALKLYELLMKIEPAEAAKLVNSVS